MNIFTELHGAYYKAAEAVLTHLYDSPKPLSERQITEIIAKHAFKDSALFIPEKLIPKGERPSDWGLLKAVPEGYVSVLCHKPRQILTRIQKSWLSAKLRDPRMGLFLTNEECEKLREFLKNEPPLYDDKIFRRFDMFSDGDDYADPRYGEIFRTMLTALRNREYVTVRYLSGKGGEALSTVLPIAAEYSGKNDKFRIHSVTEKGSGLVLNIGRIASAELTGTKAARPEKISAEKYFSQRRCTEPVVVEIKPERNGLERFMLEFASYEKESVLDTETGICTAKIWYDRADETELLIMLLSFGPVIEIIAPCNIRRQAAERANRQYRLFFPEG